MDVWTAPYPLRTERLLLRPHVDSDLDDLLVFHSDPEVVRYTPWPVRDREQTAAALAKKLTQYSASADGEWLVLAIVEQATGTVVGEVLLKREDAAAGHAELGYALSRAAQGRGLATEAARAMISLAVGSFGVTRIDAVIDPRNAPSERVLLRLGFTAVEGVADDAEGEAGTRRFRFDHV